MQLQGSWLLFHISEYIRYHQASFNNCSNNFNLFCYFFKFQLLDIPLGYGKGENQHGKWLTSKSHCCFYIFCKINLFIHRIIQNLKFIVLLHTIIQFIIFLLLKVVDGKGLGPSFCLTDQEFSLCLFFFYFNMILELCQSLSLRMLLFLGLTGPPIIGLLLATHKMSSSMMRGVCWRFDIDLRQIYIYKCVQT